MKTPTSVLVDSSSTNDWDQTVAERYGKGPDFPDEFRDLPQFVPEDEMKPDNACQLLGPRRSGKTFLTKDLLKRYWRYVWPHMRVYTRTGVYENAWPQIPRDYVTEGFDPEHLQVVFADQENLITCIWEKLKQDKLVTRWDNAMETIPKHINIYLGIIFDDVVGSVGLHSDKTLETMYVLGRHQLLAPVLLSQHVKAISPSIRTNSDWNFLFRFRTKDELNAVAENYMGVHYDEAVAIYDRYAQDKHISIVVNGTSTSTKDQRVFWYSADDNLDDKFIVGCKDYWLSAKEDNPFTDPEENSKTVIKEEEKRYARFNRGREGKSKIQLSGFSRAPDNMGGPKYSGGPEAPTGAFW